MRLLPIDMMLAWKKQKRKFIREIFLEEIKETNNRNKIKTD